MLSRGLYWGYIGVMQGCIRLEVCNKSIRAPNRMNVKDDGILDFYWRSLLMEAAG